MTDYLRLRKTFDEDAERYDRARPGYPPAVFDRLLHALLESPPGTVSGGDRGFRVLEIGCGTGQATRPLAECGFQVTAVELGEGMSAVARRNLAAFPSVEVITAPFEEWPLPAEPFDLVFSATAFHWIDPAIRVEKAADALRPGGILATVATHHVKGGTEAFFAAAQDCYERWDPATEPGLRLQPAAEIPRDDAEIAACARFGPAVSHRYEWDAAYDTNEYLDVLMTYSGHRALPEPRLRGLLGCLATLIDEHHGGRIVKRYLNELRLAVRTGIPQ